MEAANGFSRGLYAWFGYELPLAASLERIREAGFDAVSLWWADAPDGLTRTAQADLARKTGLTVENAHAPFDGCNDLWVPGLRGDEAAAGLLACVSDCAVARVPVLVVHLTDGPAPPPDSSVGLERLRPVVDTAERLGVKLAFENLRHIPHLRKVLDAFDSPCVGLCYDSGHHHGWGREADWLADYGSRLFTLHLHDNDGKQDSHSLPFDGGIDWRPLARKIARTGYTGPTSLEVQAGGGYEERMPAAAFLQRAADAAARIGEMRAEEGRAFSVR